MELIEETIAHGLFTETTHLLAKLDQQTSNKEHFERLKFLDACARSEWKEAWLGILPHYDSVMRSVKTIEKTERS